MNVHDLAAPVGFLGLFLAASFLMIWRLEAMARQGMEGTVLGTLIMPYCTGMGNLVFTFLWAVRGGSGAEVVTNCLVNNVTNLTLLVGLPIALWGMRPGVKLDRGAIIGTLAAAIVFAGASWAAARAGRIGFVGGAALVALFLAWQAWHVLAAARNVAGRPQRYAVLLVIDLALLLAGSYALYASTDGLVRWLSTIPTGFLSARYMGWLSGWLDVLPNAALALYYGWKRQPEVVYTSQIGDGHICIPLCLGIFALWRPMELPAFFAGGMIILLGVSLIHLGFVAALGRLPRVAGWALVGAYGVFLYLGLFR
ncbi:MAG TPA: sodium:calcium symporter [Verrucomicrobiae bacterium]|jgi:cation:H+ antiporter|nr:sodium:calcium symporter [Verrucomicrobiae bacterium]